MTKQNNSNWLDNFISKNAWAVLVLLLGIAAGVAVTNYRLSAMEASQQSLIADIKLWRDQLEARVGTNNKDIAVIQSKLSQIMEANR